MSSDRPGTDAPATLVFLSGKILSSASSSRAYEALAVSGGVVSSLGSDEEIRELVRPGTRVVDLRGRLVLPAFGDAHIHAVSGGLESLQCDLSRMRGRAAYLERVASYVEGLAPGTWVLGGGWSMESFPGGTPTAADLDPIVGTRPVFLPNRDHHSAWVSTAALERAGIDARTPDPDDGRIERAADGSPTGALHEGAMGLVSALLPPVAQDDLDRALLEAQRRLHAFGITHFQDAAVGVADELGVEDTYGTYRRAAEAGTLTASVVGALWWDRHRGLEQIDEILTRREAASAGPFRATSVKIMVDGVCETFTAAMTNPYLGADGRPSGHSGSLFIDPEMVRAAVVELARAGFQVHFHAIGDRAVTVALDALEALPAGERASGRHHLAHLQFIRPDDLPRFSALGAIANFQPLWACHEPQMDELTIPFVGPERAGWQYSIGSLSRLGARVAFGSDWPVSTPDPLQEVHVAVNRRLSAREGRPGTRECTDPFLAEEGLPLAPALEAFSAGVAYVNHAEDRLGALRPGMSADLVVFDEDLFAIPATQIGATSVAMTVAGGKVVYGDE